MINEEMVLERISEMLESSFLMKEAYGNEEHVAYACGFLDKALIELSSYIEGLRQDKVVGIDPEGYLLIKKAEGKSVQEDDKADCITRAEYLSKVQKVYDLLENRIETYEDEITDCQGDHEIHFAYERLIEEERGLLGILIEIFEEK